MKKWTQWQDWAAVVIGLYVALSTIWTTAAGASIALMIVLGVLLVAAGLVNLAMPGRMSLEWVVAVIGVLLFISPWAGVYATEAGAAWTSWIGGVLAAAAGVWALQPAMRTHHGAQTSH